MHYTGDARSDLTTKDGVWMTDLLIALFHDTAVRVYRITSI
jgi:hypothetical protein